MMSASSLLDEQRSAGGITRDHAPDDLSTCRFCLPPVIHFGDAREEYLALRQSAGVIDVSDRSQIELGGKDARAFLHNFCTNDIKGLATGCGCEAFVTSVKGRILAHILVFATETTVWVEAGTVAEENLLTHFDRYLFSEEVQLQGRSGDFGELLLSGPLSAEKLKLLGVPAGSLGPLQHVTHLRPLEGLAVRRADLLGQPGFLLSARRTDLVRLWRQLVAAGVRPCGSEAFHACRIEAGWPLYGLDLSEENLAQEAGRTELAISFTKGCYLGQEPIARIDALGHVNRQLCRVRLDSSVVPRLGDLVLAADQRPAGKITSSVRLPGESQSVALAMLRTDYHQPGTQLEVSSGSGQMSARVG